MYNVQFYTAHKYRFHSCSTEPELAHGVTHSLRSFLSSAGRDFINLLYSLFSRFIETNLHVVGDSQETMLFLTLAVFSAQQPRYLQGASQNLFAECGSRSLIVLSRRKASSLLLGTIVHIMT